MLYIVATLLYPGGSQMDQNAKGFSWLHNYWCNLLNDYAINGQPNTAQPIALTAMLSLCVALSFFWVLFPVYIGSGKVEKRIIQCSGVIAMLSSIFLFSNYDHDIVTNLASLFGTIATIGVFTRLYKTKWYDLFLVGCFNMLLVVINNYLYYSKDLIIYLPVVQKITFAFFLTWICWIVIRVYKKGL